MATHVTGGNTPPRLAKLRRAIYALIGDQLLFPQAEQLQLSLAAHECQDAAELRRQLARLQHEADRRLRVLALQGRASQGRLIASPRTQRKDLDWLARQANREYGAVSEQFKVLGGLAWCLQTTADPKGRTGLVGDAYQLVAVVQRTDKKDN